MTNTDRPKAERDLFAERGRLLSKTRISRADRLRLAEIDVALETIPTRDSPEDQAAMDLLHDTARFFVESGAVSEERRDMLVALRRENYELRERVAELERGPGLPGERLRRFKEVARRARDVTYHYGESDKEDFKDALAVLEAALDRLQAYDLREGLLS